MAATEPRGTLTRIDPALQALPHPSEISLGDSGVTADAIKFLYGPATGYMFLGRFAPDGSGDVHPLACVRVDTIDHFFPEFVEDLMVDGLQSINTMYRPGSEKDRPYPGAGLPNPPIARRRSVEVENLTACWVDLDCHKVGLTPWSAMAEVGNAADRGEIPGPSAFLLSGRGLWVFWRLRDHSNPDACPGGFDNLRALAKKINQKLASVFASLGADSKCVDMARVRRVAGGINSKSGERVRLIGICPSPTYTLNELAGHLNISPRFRQALTALDPNRERDPEMARRGRRRGIVALNEFEVIRGTRDGFRQGLRHNVLFTYAKLLRKTKHTADEVRDLVYQLASEMVPPLTTDAKGRDERDHVIEASKDYPREALSRHDIAQLVRLTPDEADQMPHDSRNRRQWWGHTDPRWDRTAKARQIPERRDAILGLVHRTGCVASYRQMADALGMLGFDVSHVTVKNDYAALHLISDTTRLPKTSPLFAA